LPALHIAGFLAGPFPIAGTSAAGDKDLPYDANKSRRDGRRSLALLPILDPFCGQLLGNPLAALEQVKPDPVGDGQSQERGGEHKGYKLSFGHVDLLLTGSVSL
jgi:hypothetical protein